MWWKWNEKQRLLSYWVSEWVSDENYDKDEDENEGENEDEGENEGEDENGDEDENGAEDESRCFFASKTRHKTRNRLLLSVHAIALHYLVNYLSVKTFTWAIGMNKDIPLMFQITNKNFLIKLKNLWRKTLFGTGPVANWVAN